MKTKIILLIVLACFALAPIYAQEDTGFQEIIHFGRGVPRSAAWSPDGNLILVNSIIGAWLYAGNDLSDVIHFPQESAQFSPDGRWLVGKTEDGSITIREGATWEIIALPEGFSGDYFSPNSRWLLGRNPQNENVLLNTETFRPMILPEALQDSTVYLIWSPDSRKLLGYSGNDRLLVWRIGEPKLAWEGRTDYVGYLLWSPDSQKILKNNVDDNRVQIWDAATGKPLIELPSQEKQHITTGEELRGSVVWMPDSRRIMRFYASNDIVNVEVVDTESGQPITVLRGGQVFYILFSPDGKWYATTDGVHDSQTYQQISELYTFAFQWSPDGQWLAAPRAVMPYIDIIEASSGHTVDTLEGEPETYTNNVLWSPDKHKLLFWSSTGVLHLWDINSRKEVAALKQHLGYETPSVNNDGSRLAVADQIGGVWLWNLETGQLIDTLQGHIGKVEVLEWQPNGTLLATQNSSDPTRTFSEEANIIRIWDGKTGNLVDTIDGFVPVVWSPDGSRLYTGTYDNDLIVWDPFTQLQFQLKVAIGSGYVAYPDISWSPDKTILTLDYNTGTHGGQSIRLYEDRNLKLLAKKIDYVLSDSYRWNADSTRITMLSMRCKPYSNEDCSITFRTVFDRTNPPLDTGINMMQIPVEATIGPFETAPDNFWSPDGYLLCLINHDNRTVEIWDVHRRPIKRLRVIEDAEGMSWSPDSTLYSIERGTAEQRITEIFKTDTGETLTRFENFDSIAWVDNHQVRLWRGQESSLWDAVTGESPVLPPGTLYARPIGNLYIESSSGVIRVWARHDN